ncbi:hypothetical protein [Acetobacter cerevisiae]|uniref:hypothetical protein n=1 Tax=Acetobacter cerevisiae TaxID=178900 RepID=UPI0012E6FCF6|nr:hypothetical protein [Acetobacter cerevisiae]
MFHYNLEQVAATLSVLHLNQQTDDFAAKSMTTLFAFGQHNIGMVRFEGSTRKSHRRVVHRVRL